MLELEYGRLPADELLTRRPNTAQQVPLRVHQGALPGVRAAGSEPPVRRTTS